MVFHKRALHTPPGHRKYSGTFVWYMMGRSGATPSNIQLDLANSNSLILNSLVFQTQKHFPFPLDFFFGNLLAAISNSLF